MPPPPLQIIEIHTHDQPRWQVWLGKRCWTFEDPHQARQVAAQLHLRLSARDQPSYAPTPFPKPKHP